MMKGAVVVLILLVQQLSISIGQNNNLVCQLCRSGSLMEGGSHPLPKDTFMTPVELANCSDVDQYLGTFSVGEECDTALFPFLQFFNTQHYCGCPEEEPAGVCHLCNSQVIVPNETLPQPFADFDCSLVDRFYESITNEHGCASGELGLLCCPDVAPLVSMQSDSSFPETSGIANYPTVSPFSTPEDAAAGSQYPSAMPTITASTESPSLSDNNDEISDTVETSESATPSMYPSVAPTMHPSVEGSTMHPAEIIQPTVKKRPKSLVPQDKQAESPSVAIEASEESVSSSKSAAVAAEADFSSSGKNTLSAFWTTSLNLLLFASIGMNFFA